MTAVVFIRFFGLGVGGVSEPNNSSNRSRNRSVHGEHMSGVLAASTLPSGNVSTVTEWLKGCGEPWGLGAAARSSRSPGCTRRTSSEASALLLGGGGWRDGQSHTAGGMWSCVSLPTCSHGSVLKARWSWQLGGSNTGGGDRERQQLSNAAIMGWRRWRQQLSKAATLEAVTLESSALVTLTLEAATRLAMAAAIVNAVDFAKDWRGWDSRDQKSASNASEVPRSELLNACWLDLTSFACLEYQCLKALYLLYRV